MDLEIRHLQLVTAIAAHGNLTRASEVLHLTQSALSHQLRDIEDRLNTRLFDRRNRRMVATPLGERLLASAETVLAELRAAERDIRAGLSPQTIPLRISTECYTCYHWLPPVLKALGEECPRVDLHVETSATHQPLRALLAGKLDVAIMSTPVRMRGLVSAPLFEDERVMLVPTTHPLASRPWVELTDFRDLTLFTYSPPEQSEFVAMTLRRAGVRPASVRPVQITEALIEFVKAGMGVAVLARWAVHQHLETSRTLRAVRITERGLSRQWSAVYPRTLEGTAHVELFVELVRQHAPVGAPHRPLVLARPKRASLAG